METGDGITRKTLKKKSLGERGCGRDLVTLDVKTYLKDSVIKTVYEQTDGQNGIESPKKTYTDLVVET